MTDPILAGIQAALDNEGDGWQATAYVVMVGCERLTSDTPESEQFRYDASGQPRWITSGLIVAALDVWESESTD